MATLVAPSSRRAIVQGLVAIAFAPSCSRRAATKTVAPPGPRLVAEEQGSAREGLAPDDGRALWLLLASLPEARRRALLDDVTAQITAAEAKTNRLMLNFLDDEPPSSSFFPSRPWLAPSLNAARALTCQRWAVPGGGFVRAFAEGVAPPEGAVAAWAVQQGEAERLRFAAWPTSFGVFARFATADDTRRGTAALTERVGRDDSPLAVMLSGTGLGPALERPVIALSARARRSKDEFVTFARLLAEGPPAGPPCPWLAPRENEIYVVPRLGELVRHAGFVDEVRRTMRDAGASAQCHDARRGVSEAA